MPQFDILSINEAQIQSTTGKRAEILREYIGYIGELKEGQAGRLSADQGETLGAVRRRLGSAAKLLSQALVIKRTDECVYFWNDATVRRKRGRPRRSSK